MSLVLPVWALASVAIGAAATYAHASERGRVSRDSCLIGIGWAVAWPLAVPFVALLVRLDRQGRLQL